MFGVFFLLRLLLPYCSDFRSERNEIFVPGVSFFLKQISTF